MTKKMEPRTMVPHSSDYPCANGLHAVRQGDSAAVRQGDGAAVRQGDGAGKGLSGWRSRPVNGRPMRAIPTASRPRRSW